MNRLLYQLSYAAMWSKDFGTAEISFIIVSEQVVIVKTFFRFFAGRKGATINTMVIGAGGTGKIVLQELEREKTVRPVCALNYKEIGFGSLLDGVPVVNGVENLKGAIEKYRVNFVIIASAVMPQEVRNRI